MDEMIDTRKVVEWLNRHWQGSKVCPICNSNDWNVSGRPLELREFHGTGLVVGGPVYPLIGITCKVCGYTLLFNAIVAQLMKPKQEKTASSTKTEQSEEEQRRRRL